MTFCSEHPRTKPVICTPKAHDEHPRSFRIGTPSHAIPGAKQTTIKAKILRILSIREYYEFSSTLPSNRKFWIRNKEWTAVRNKQSDRRCVSLYWPGGRTHLNIYSSHWSTITRDGGSFPFWTNMSNTNVRVWPDSQTPRENWRYDAQRNINFWRNSRCLECGQLTLPWVFEIYKEITE